jgi:intein/homing endonuclease
MRINVYIIDGVFILMALSDNILFSKKDVLKGVKIPQIMTSELAEVLGVILGDGHLECNKKYKSNRVYLLNIAGSYSEDFDYYNIYFRKVFFNLFNFNFKIYLRRNDELVINIYSKAIANFFESLGVHSGNKTGINEIPLVILNSKEEIKRSFIRGLFDTDGSITFKKDSHGKHSNPVISITMKSQKFIEQLSNFMKEFGFTYSSYIEKYFDKRVNKISIKHRLDFAGKKNLERYLKLIGFSNPRHLTKVGVFNKNGFYTPKTPYNKRKIILEN